MKQASAAGLQPILQVSCVLVEPGLPALGRPDGGIGGGIGGRIGGGALGQAETRTHHLQAFPKGQQRVRQRFGGARLADKAARLTQPDHPGQPDMGAGVSEVLDVADETGLLARFRAGPDATSRRFPRWNRLAGIFKTCSIF